MRREHCEEEEALRPFEVAKNDLTTGSPHPVKNLAS